MAGRDGAARRSAAGARPLRLATWNVEWFDALFEPGTDRLLADGDWSARHRVTRRAQAEAIATVLHALDADGLLVVEAPGTSAHPATLRRLQGFADWAGLRSSAVQVGIVNDSQQQLAFLYDPARLSVRHEPRGGPAAELGQAPAPAFDRQVRIDIDGDGLPEPLIFTKPPLQLAVEAGALRFRLTGVHIKSKAPIGARSPEEAVRLQIANRRKQLAQCLWLRARLVEDMNAGEAQVVMGDFNDGPGLDEWERLFGQSGVEIVMGEQGPLHLYDPHARMALAQRGGARPTTARFLVPCGPAGAPAEDWRWLPALLDYIMVSPALRERDPRWRIWHPFDDPQIYARDALREALLTASDHFPVSLELRA